jgi:hypothetical protein
MFLPGLDRCNPAAGVALVPGAVELFGYVTELHDQIAGKVLRPDFAPFLAPQAHKGSLVIAHNDPGVRSANEMSTLNFRPLTV